MIKVEDVTDPSDICNNPRHSRRVMQITGSESELSKLEAILLVTNQEMSNPDDQTFWEGFVHRFTSACCW